MAQYENLLHAPRGWTGSAHLPSGCRMLLSARPGAIGAIRFGLSRYSASQPVQAGTSCVGGFVAKVQKREATCWRAQARQVLPTDHNGQQQPDLQVAGSNLNVVLTGKETVVLEDRPIPECPKGYVLVKVMATGM
jgi:hypothetical protein